MVHYIDKSALVAEIERQKAQWRICKSSEAKYRREMLDDISSFIDTLEVKEVDLEKELNYDDYINFFNEHPDYNNNDWGFDEAWMFANYFFKLGMAVSNKQIEEKKNIDSLEEKCNTIYKDITMIGKDGNTINAKIEQREKV